MRHRLINRRAMLLSAGASLSLPMLDIFSTKSAFADSVVADSTKRLVYLYFPNGAPEGTWSPKKVTRHGKLLELNPWMSPLEPFKDDLIIPRGLWMPEGDGHHAGPPNWLTGRGFDDDLQRTGNLSVDQVAAEHLGRETLLPSLELSLKGEGFFSNSLPRNSISWSKSHTPLPRETEPQAVFDRMFRPPGGGATNQTVLDGVLSQARRLRKQLGRADKRRVDEYFESIRALEKRIEFSKKQSSALSADKALTDSLIRPVAGIPSSHEEYVRQMLDLLVLALQTDATRVITFMLDHGQSNRYFNFIPGVRGTWHALSHYSDASGRTDDDDGKTRWRSVKEKRSMYAEVNRWHHAQFAYLLGRLKSIREPDGRTLLDNCAIIYGSSLGDGDEHGNRDLPTIIAGGAGGNIRTGRQLKLKRQTMSSLHLSMLQKLGIEVDQFGASRRTYSGL
ncbi:MAG: DUF1552 domain-containing protein [Planctomycetota bacterium]